MKKVTKNKKLIQIHSRFTGGTFKLLFLLVTTYLGTAFTLGIAYPWLTCVLYRWEADNTVIDGRRQYFDGKGGELFKNYIKWLALTIITLGIYKLWLTRNVMVWKISHTHFKDSKAPASFYKCTIREKILMLIKYYAIIIFTLSLGKGAASCYKTRWTLNHTNVDGAYLDFDGKTLAYLGVYLRAVLLVIITAGIYALFFPVSLKRWEVKHTRLK